MRSTRKKLVEYPAKPSAAAVKLFDTAPVAAQNESQDPIDHNIGATIKICSMLLKSWIKEPATQAEPLQILSVLLPGSKTTLAYNPAEETVCIYDGLHGHYFEKGKTHPKLPYPNPTDPRVASVIFCLLEETHNGEIQTLIPTVEMHSQEWVFKDQGQKELDRALFKEMVDHKMINSETLAENFAPKLTLYALKVTGKKDILKLIDALDNTFLRHKGRIIPVEKGAERSLLKTL